MDAAHRAGGGRAPQESAAGASPLTEWRRESPRPSRATCATSRRPSACARRSPARRSPTAGRPSSSGSTGEAVPVYAFPDADVRRDLLADSANPLPDAHGGSATFYTLTAGAEPVENAAWRYSDTDLAGHVALSWEAHDRWLEEEDEVFGHPRDPWHRVDGRRSSRHVRVEIGGAA